MAIEFLTNINYGGVGLTNFTGDTGSGGAKGLVPAPAAGDAASNKFLKSDGTFATATQVLARRTTATGSIANSETVVVSGTAGANVLKVGTILRLQAYGVQSNGTQASTSIYRIRIGTTTLTGNIPATASYVNITTSQTNAILRVTADVLVTAVSSSGTAIGQIMADGGSKSSTNAITGVTAAVTVNTTVSNLVEFTYISGHANTSAVFHTAAIEIIQP